MLQPDSHQQRIIIVGEGSVFDEGVMLLLTQRTDSLVSRVIYSDDLAFLNNIKSDRPDVILVCDSGSLEATRVFDLISAHPMVMGLRIVVVRLRNNVIDVYPQSTFVGGKPSGKPRKIIARSRDDLLNACFQ